MDPKREWLHELYAAALEEGAEGGARFLASHYFDTYDEDIEDAMISAGWTLNLYRGQRRLVR